MRTEDSTRVNYQAIAVSQSAKVLGLNGAKGDILQRIIVTVSTSGANGTCSITDGSGSAISIIPASAILGTHIIEIGAKSTSGAWKVTTGSAATALAIGSFSCG